MLQRLPRTPPRLMRGLAVAAVVGQAGIAVTGSVVRVTGSGLGCPTWPQCFPGSLVPTPHPEVEALRQWVEFGNRLLTFALVLVAGAAFLAALNLARRHRRVTWLALAMPLGVVAQAVLGGITVLTGLAWYTVALHFLVSMVLVWLAVLLVRACAPDALAAPPGTPRARTVPQAARGLLLVLGAVMAALLTAGTLVTSAGPHAGDAATPRLDVAVTDLATLHADLLFAFLGLLVGFGFLARAVEAPAGVTRCFRVLVLVTLAQGVLGGVQYALGVPELLVALHVLGAALTVAATAALWASTTTAGTPGSARWAPGSSEVTGTGPAGTGRTDSGPADAGPADSETTDTVAAGAARPGAGPTGTGPAAPGATPDRTPDPASVSAGRS